MKVAISDLDNLVQVTTIDSCTNFLTGFGTIWWIYSLFASKGHHVTLTQVWDEVSTSISDGQTLLMVN